MLNVVLCNVTCEMWWCDVNNGVVHGEYGSVRWCKMWNWCGCGIPSDVEWFDAMLDMVVWCGMVSGWSAVWDVWCGLECVDVGWAIYIWMWCGGMSWCEVECRRDVEWCAEMWWSDLMWIMVDVQCGAIDVECCHFRHGAMWNLIELPQNRCDVECGVVRNVVS